MQDLSNLSAAKLNALHSKREAAHFVSVDKMISAGLGHLRHTDLESRAGSCALCAECLETYKAWNQSGNELRARKEYSGTHKPIKRACLP